MAIAAYDGVENYATRLSPLVVANSDALLITGGNLTYKDAVEVRTIDAVVDGSLLSKLKARCNSRTLNAVIL